MALAATGIYLVDTRATTLEPINDGIFVVDTNAVRLEASGLSGSDKAVVQILVGPNSGDALWTDLHLGGSAVQLDKDNTQTIIMLSGKYRVHYAGSAEVVVYSEEDNLELDKNVFYNYMQPSIVSGGGGGSGFDLTTEEKPSLYLAFSGDSSGGSIYGYVKVSGDAGNTIVTHSNGIYSPAPSMPWSAQSVTFGLETDGNHSYTVTAASEDIVEVTLPNPTETINNIYCILALGTGTVELAAGSIGWTINGMAGPVLVPSGAAAWLTSDGVDNWIVVMGTVPSTP